MSLGLMAEAFPSPRERAPARRAAHQGWEGGAICAPGAALTIQGTPAQKGGGVGVR